MSGLYYGMVSFQFCIFQMFSRKGNQSWGLRLVGGQDVGTLLKVEKVE